MSNVQCEHVCHDARSDNQGINKETQVSRTNDSLSATDEPYGNGCAGVRPEKSSSEIESDMLSTQAIRKDFLNGHARTDDKMSASDSLKRSSEHLPNLACQSGVNPDDPADSSPQGSIQDEESHSGSSEDGSLSTSPQRTRLLPYLTHLRILSPYNRNKGAEAVQHVYGAGTAVCPKRSQTNDGFLYEHRSNVKDLLGYGASGSNYTSRSKGSNPECYLKSVPLSLQPYEMTSTPSKRLHLSEDKLNQAGHPSAFNGHHSIFNGHHSALNKCNENEVLSLNRITQSTSEGDRSGHSGQTSSRSVPEECDKGERGNTQPKPVWCSVCRKKLRRKQYLKAHLRIHTKEMPYRCRFCSKAFNQVGNCRVHERRHR